MGPRSLDEIVEMYLEMGLDEETQARMRHLCDLGVGGCPPEPHYLTTFRSNTGHEEEAADAQLA
jgi:hypothetical protein